MKPQKIEAVSVGPEVRAFLQEFYRNTVTELVYVAVNVSGLVIEVSVAGEKSVIGLKLPAGDYLIAKVVDAPLPPGAGLFAVQSPDQS